MKLAKALVQKKKLEGEINKLSNKLRSVNSVMKPNVHKAAIQDVFNEYRSKIDELLALKLKITLANSEIYEKIYKISEYKGIIKNIQSIGVQDGFSQDFKGNIIEYVSQWSENDIAEKIKHFEGLIELLHDEINTFNYTKEI